ncbi:uncharacterized protein FMAN_08710 [Fusarium mangiferae]|uniref:Uncharacterized protein n=1 Tax=Fusarium mangiferae TaxID=192010 RepID=A0A1L7T0L8_FUSMA|nr:uncharacterized protein FMAN_08710 [Fusarium mangiferae]CVK90262.1 uncharacterized protein FMAN_08710 [Fusarium mangiferae]
MPVFEAARLPIAHHENEWPRIVDGQDQLQYCEYAVCALKGDSIGDVVLKSLWGQVLLSPYIYTIYTIPCLHQDPAFIPHYKILDQPFIKAHITDDPTPNGVPSLYPLNMSPTAFESAINKACETAVNNALNGLQEHIDSVVTTKVAAQRE